ncbi:hypothetical protein EVAR_59098_1 [Eumeta japonica]|uniref:Uncharacterized protein n=1 Tax=Eumeta variegata TaxID=151549 RepID=A0A4C1YZQ6_EUMVA|nr:hypothetical protein EVAR_59098_1 [Eumeta japonica]
MGGIDHLLSSAGLSKTVRRDALGRRDIVPGASHVDATKSSEPQAYLQENAYSHMHQDFRSVRRPNNARVTTLRLPVPMRGGDLTSNGPRWRSFLINSIKK